MTRWHSSLDGPVSRLQAHAEANAEDVEILTAVLTEARRRGTPEADEAAARVQVMLDALTGQGEGPETTQDAAARLETTTLLLHDLRARLEVAEQRTVEAEVRAAEMERRAEAVAMAAKAAGTALPALHARIYLAPTAPGWLVGAVERAFRHRYHPDRHDDPVRKERAVAVLSDAETVFAHLRAAKGEPASR